MRENRMTAGDTPRGRGAGRGVLAASAIGAALCLGACAAPPDESPAEQAGASAPPPVREVDGQGDAGAGAVAEGQSGQVAPSRASQPAREPDAATGPGPVADPPPPPVMAEEFRPGWWLQEPVVKDGRLYIAANADATTIRDSRRGAVTQAEGYAAEWSGVSPRDGQVEHVRTVRTEQGYFRTFVLMSWACGVKD